MRKTKVRVLSWVLTALMTLSMFNGFTKANAEAISRGLTKDELKARMEERLSSYSPKAVMEANLAQKFGKGIDKPIDENNSTRDKQEETIRIIVQLQELPALDKIDIQSKAGQSQALSAEKTIKSNQASVISKVEAITGTKVIRNFGYLVNGFSINVKRKQISQIQALKGVKAVTESRVYYPDMKFAKELTQAYSAWNELGYKGEGMVISIIDTGIDYTHKDLKISNTTEPKLTKSYIDNKAAELKHGKFFTEKVPYGYNYADGNTNVIDKGSMHGMHVAGIVAANGDSTQVDSFNAVQGVAPEAQLLAMKVFSNNLDLKGAYDDDTIAAIEDSVKLGADVVNMSLGSPAGFQDKDDPTQKAITNAINAGVLMVISAGNDGVSTTDDSWKGPQVNLFGTTDTAVVASPGLAEDALTVASFENSQLTLSVMEYADNNSKSGQMFFQAVEGTDMSLLKTPREMVYCGLGNPSDIPGDLSGKIALIKRGSISFTDKAKNAVARNAYAVIIFNSDGQNEPIGMTCDEKSVPVLSIGNSDGELLKSLIPTNVKVSIKGSMASKVNSSVNDMSQFTSWGPTPNLDIKPEITAPGGDIYSLANDNKYQNMSGTSMSAPHTSGSEALILQAIKSRNKTISGRELIEFAKITTLNTAQVMMDKYSAEVPYSPRRQGAGMIQIADAIKNNVLVTYLGKGTVPLKEISGTTSFELKLKNYGDKEVRFNLVPGTVYTEMTNAQNQIFETALKGASLNGPSGEIVLAAGAEKTIALTLKLAEDTNKDIFVEGFIKLNCTSSNNPNLSLPYMGFYGQWSKLQIMDGAMWDKAQSHATKFFNDKYSNIYTNYYGFDIKVNMPVGTGLGELNSDGEFVPFAQYYAEEDTPDYLYVDNGINPNYIGFSPNDDGLRDSILPNLYLLRNSKELSVQILDKNKNVLTTLDKMVNVRKNLLEDHAAKDDYTRTFSSTRWDGSVYDKATGKYKVLSDGNYYYRIVTKADMPNAEEQILEMPMKIDTVAPTLSNIKVVKEKNRYYLNWQATDDATGIFDDVTMIYLNGVKLDTSAAEKNGSNYKMKISYSPNGVNYLQMGIVDNAGNFTFAEEILSDKLPTLTLLNTVDGMYLNRADLMVDDSVQYQYTILGVLNKNNVDKLLVNNQEVTIDANGCFSQEVDLNEGANIIQIKALKGDAEIINGSLTINVDTNAPTINITSPVVKDGEVYNVYGDNVDVEGIVSDKDVIAVEINGTAVTLDAEGKFNGKATLKGGLNAVNITAVDLAGNLTTKSLLISARVDSEPFRVFFTNLAPLNILGGQDVKDDIFYVSGYVNRPISEFTINGETVQIRDDLSFDVPVKLHQGTNVIKVFARDKDIVVMEYGYKILYDSVLPTITLDAPIIRQDGNVYVNTDTVTIKGTAYDNMYGYSLYINGDAILTIDQSPNMDTDNLKRPFEKTVNVENGDNIEVVIVDQFGNANTIKLKVIVDKTAPVITAKVDNTEPTNQPVNVTISCEDKDLDNLEYSFDNSNFFQYTAPIQVAANTKIYIRATDFAGNVSNKTVEITNIDLTAPGVPNISSDITAITNKDITLTIVAPEDNDLLRVEYSFDNNSWKEYKEPIVVDSNCTIYARAIDKVGNIGEIAKYVVANIYRVKPIITITGVENNKEYTSPVTPVIKADTDIDKWTITLNGKDYDGSPVSKAGEYELKVLAEDKAGNIGEAVLKFAIKEAGGGKGGQIVKTGSVIDTTVLVISGLLCLALGGYFLVIKRSRKE